MYIKSINIERFGKLSSLSLDFSSGLNVVQGNNETGKTTVCAFIKFIFYGLSSAERAKYIPWGESSCSGTLTLCHNGEEYTIERTLLLLQRGVNEKTVITNSDCVPVFRDSTPDKVFLGVGEKVFCSSAYIGEISGTTVDGKQLNEAIENLLFSADEELNTARAIKKLDEERVTLWHKNKKGGEIFTLEKNIAELELKLSEAQSITGEIFKLRDRVSSDREKRVENAASAEEISAKLDEFSAYLAIASCEKCRDAEKEMHEAEKTYNESLEKCTINGTLPDGDYVGRLRELKAELSSAESELSASEQALKSAEESLEVSRESAETLDLLNEEGGEHTVLSKTEELEAASKKFGKLFAVGAVLCVLFLLGAAGCAVINQYLICAALGVLGVISIVLAVMAKSKSKKCSVELSSLSEKFGCESGEGLIELIERIKEEEKTITKKRSDIEGAGLRCDRLRNKIDEKKREIEEFSAKYKRCEPNCESLDNEIGYIQQIISLLASLKAELDKKTALYNTLAEQTSGIDVAEQKKRICGKLKTAELTQFNENEQKHRLAFLRQSIEVLDERILENEKKLSALTAGTVDAAAVFDALSLSREKLKESKQRFDALVLAGEMLNRASMSLRESVTPKLARDAGACLSLATDGKYPSLGVDENYAMTLQFDNKSHSLSCFSAGTQDVAYICLRLSLVATLYRQSPPPLMLDDSLAHLDGERLLRVLALISSKCKSDKMQCIIFTCGKRESDACMAIPESNIVRIKTNE